MKSQPPTFQRSLFLLLIRLQKHRHQESGYSLVVSIAMLLILSTLLITAAIVSKVDTSSTSASAKSSTGFFAAEAGLNVRAKQIRERFEGYNRPTGTTPADSDSDGERWDSCASGSSLGSGDFVCTNNSFQGQNVVTYVEDKTVLVGGQPQSITIPTNEKFGGLSAQEYRYDLVSVARDADLPTAILSMSFKSRVVPLFQFAVFYNKDLEILPGPNMTLNGPVHTNGDLYLGSGATLTINGQVTVGKDEDGSSNGLYRGRKNDSTCGGTVNIYNPGSAVAAACSGSSRTQITNLSPWNNRVRTNVEYLEVPPPEALDASSSSEYWQKADLRIVLEVDSNGNPSDRNSNGTVLEVRNANGSRNDTATTALQNSCNNIAEATLANDNDGTPAAYEDSDVNLYLDDASAFSIGDIITLVDASGNVIDADSNIIKSKSGNTITLQRQLKHGYQSSVNINPSTKVRRAIVSTSDTFYNYREGKFIRMLDIDARGLLTCLDSNGNSLSQNLMDSNKALNDESEGGLVWHFSVDGPASNRDVTDTVDDDGVNGAVDDGNNYGVRVRNGSQLASTNSSAPAIKGLTVVTDQALYVRGSYNSTNKKPAAFLADSLNVLSNNWDFGFTGTDPDTDSFDGRKYGTTTNLPDAGADTKADRNASNTTIYAAFLGGTDSTGNEEGTGGQDDGNYNGGLENYPRFHETWSGDTLTYRGSFVSLNKARRVDGAWASQSYDAPTRDWNFDTDFSNAANLPPLSPRFVYLRQELFQRDFDRTSQNMNKLFASALPSIQPRFSL
ncbi:MAG: hypothetical protein HC851_21895 [Acaryochloris sp. RU_4_1]|nr:hypothetical protein [Acaryochloris sp. RU_4_1]